ncbi:MAG: VOC family protein [Polyangiaceae bacterium]
MENTYRVGQFAWRELMTRDTAKARAFYTEMFGWVASDMPMPQGTYTTFKNGDAMVAGMMEMPKEAPVDAAWMSYVSVPDVDAAVKAATENGGTVMLPGTTMPGVGRFAMVADSTGGVIGLLRGETGDSPAPFPPPAGAFCWESLNTTDIDKSKAFYSKVAGWTTGTGPGGMPVFMADTVQVADVQGAPPGVPTHWLLHVVVDKLDAARTKAEQAGAKVMMPRIDIPTIGAICIITDPTGAAISLFEPAPPAAA